MFEGSREISATGSDNRIPVTITGLNLPDGKKLGVTVRDYQTSYNGHSVRSAGGTVIGGEDCANNSKFRIFTVENGEVSGQVIMPSVTGTVRLQAVAAYPNNRIGTSNSFSIKAIEVQ